MPITKHSFGRRVKEISLGRCAMVGIRNIAMEYNIAQSRVYNVDSEQFDNVLSGAWLLLWHYANIDPGPLLHDCANRRGPKLNIGTRELRQP